MQVGMTDVRLLTCEHSLSLLSAYTQFPLLCTMVLICPHVASAHLVLLLIRSPISSKITLDHDPPGKINVRPMLKLL